jgi:uncharacterized protein (TIGR03790 family)
MVARLDGPAMAIARGLVDKALQAERDGLWGRAYFDSAALRMALQDRRRLDAHLPSWRSGLDSNVLKLTPRHSVPVSDEPHCALSDGIGNVPAVARSKVEFMPERRLHLHSFSAATVRTRSAHWVGPLLIEA